MHMQRQKWVTDKINPPKIEKQGIGKDKLMIKSTKVQAFVLLACENSYNITKTNTPIYPDIQKSSYMPNQAENKKQK